MNIHSYTICHYGKDYLPYALRSVYNCVDRLGVFYTPHPSHGHRTDQQPPETREVIYEAVYTYDPDSKIYVFDTDIWDEGQQRNTALSVCQNMGAEMVLVVDCDEIWAEDTLRRVLQHCQEHPARNHLVNMVHFWRSFNWACRDNNWPVRIIDLTRPQDNNDVDYVPRELGDIYHFGYAVTNEIMAYKWLVHGHKDEARPNWFAEKWNVWPPAMDCHPTNDNNWWMPEPFDREQLPELMRKHPFYNLERIE